VKRILLLTGVVLGAACTEPRAPQQAPAPTLVEARLDFSDSSALPGRMVYVTVHATGKKVASMTGRLVYDSTSLAFVDEQPLQDGGTRMINPIAGAMRFAAISASGFEDGRLYVLRFTPLAANGLASLRLVVDEVHTADRADVSKALTVRTP
jgi:hypothetical protein